MIIQHEDNGKNGAHFLQGDSGDHLAEMTYVHAGKTRIIVDHTHVDDSLRGQGVGKKLLNATATYARKNGMVILATCPYAKAQLSKHREQYSDVFDG